MVDVCTASVTSARETYKQQTFDGAYHGPLGRSVNKRAKGGY